LQIFENLKKIHSCKFFSIFGHLNPGFGYAIRKNAGFGSRSALNPCGFTTLPIGELKLIQLTADAFMGSVVFFSAPAFLVLKSSAVTLTLKHSSEAADTFHKTQIPILY
jgi:hypothetical protein